MLRLTSVHLFSVHSHFNCRNIVTNLSELTIVIKGAGEMASAVAWRLYMANFKKILMLETAKPFGCQA